MQVDDFFGEDNECDRTWNNPFGALTTLDDKANNQRHHNLGYVEAFETAKDIQLQQGFDKGYGDTIHHAQRIGNILGRWAANQWMEANHTNLAIGDVATETNPTTDYDNPIMIVRGFILEQHTTDTKSLQVVVDQNSKDNPVDLKMEKIEYRLQEFIVDKK